MSVYNTAQPAAWGAAAWGAAACVAAWGSYPMQLRRLTLATRLSIGLDLPNKRATCSFVCTPPHGELETVARQTPQVSIRDHSDIKVAARASRFPCRRRILRQPAYRDAMGLGEL